MKRLYHVTIAVYAEAENEACFKELVTLFHTNPPQENYTGYGQWGQYKIKSNKRAVSVWEIKKRTNP